MFKGYKTKLGAVALAFIGAAFGLGFITKEQFDSLVLIFGGFTAFGFRDAMK